MDLIDRLRQIAERTVKLKDSVTTEEATKNAFVMPFIQALGYDVFNPLEVIPEFTADTGIKKGEKVDYCILKDNEPVIIIECKHWKEKLDNHDSQLLRYFHVTNARFGILTNGIEYRFFTDLVTPNKMDEKPFFDFSMERLNDIIIEELKKFQKHNFDVETIVNKASDLKYSRAIRKFLNEELNNPSEEFVKYLASNVYSGRITSRVLDQFLSITKSSIKQMLGEMINLRLEKAISQGDPDTEDNTSENSNNTNEIESTPGVETTEEELQAFRIIQAILMPEIPGERVYYRDSKSYCSIILDDNNRKGICRLWFNSSKWYIGLFDEEKNETKHSIQKLEDIFSFSDVLKSTADRYI